MYLTPSVFSVFSILNSASVRSEDAIASVLLSFFSSLSHALMQSLIYHCIDVVSQRADACSKSPAAICLVKASITASGSIPAFLPESPLLHPADNSTATAHTVYSINLFISVKCYNSDSRSPELYMLVPYACHPRDGTDKFLEFIAKNTCSLAVYDSY